LQGVWLYESADLTGIHKAEVDKVKAFASRTHDRARPAYGRTRFDQPRRCVIFATTNNDNYLQSQTGNRRFWPVQTGWIDVAKLKADRDQLWAEAAREEAAGVSIMLPEDLWPVAAQEQEKRRERDPWEDILCNVEGEKIVRDVDGLGYEERISSAEVLRRYLKLEPSQATHAHWKRAKRIMLALGWEHRDPLRIDSRSVTGYVRHSDQPPPDPDQEEQASRHLDPFADAASGS
jgi:predicted P-loop ATPase